MSFNIKSTAGSGEAAAIWNTVLNSVAQITSQENKLVSCCYTCRKDYRNAVFHNVLTLSLQKEHLNNAATIAVILKQCQISISLKFLSNTDVC